MYYYEYDNSFGDGKHRTGTRVGKGTVGVSNAHYVSATDWGDATSNVDDEQPYLPIARYVYTAATTTRSASRVRNDHFEYDFWDTDDTALKKIIHRRPIVSTGQNGPGGTDGTDNATTEQYFDTLGRLRWRQDAEGYVDYYSYHPQTGGVAYMVTDVDPSSPGTEVTAGESGKWEAWTVGSADSNKPSRDIVGFSSDPSALALITKAEYDPQGRQTMLIEPGGGTHVTKYFELGTLRLPYVVSGNPTLPASVSKTDPGGVLVESSTVKPSAVSTSTTSLPTTNHVTRTTYQYHATSGQLTGVRQYHKLGGTTLGTNYLETSYLYDPMGRRGATIQYVSSGKYQVAANIYDRLGRVTETRQGVASVAPTSYGALDDAINPLSPPTNFDGWAKMTETVYDEGSIGDSRVTSYKRYFGTGANDAIESIPQYTFRGHVRGAEVRNLSISMGSQVIGPTEVRDIDWLGRTTAKATYEHGASISWPSDYSAYVTEAGNATDRHNLTKIYYDDQHRVCRTEVFPGSEDTEHFEINNYYDLRGNLVASGDKYSAHREIAYDGAGRQYQVRVVTASAGTYSSRAYSYAAPAPHPVLGSMSVTGDGGVIEIKHHVFDAAQNAIERHTFEVNHDDANGIDLDTTADYVRITSHHWHDAAHRPTALAYYGSGNDSSTDDEWEYNAAPSYGSEPTASDSKKLVTLYGYHTDSGRQELITDPAGKQVKLFYDDLGRKLAVAENWVNYAYPSTGIGEGTNNEDDRVTAYAYNGLHRIVTLTAHNASTPQVTTYKYEDNLNASLVTRTIYPDGDDTNDNITVTYNLDGSRATYKDQRGVVHTYGYDNNRRMNLDGVTSFGSSGVVDTSVKSIGRTYDELGRAKTVTSWQNDDGTGTIRNQVQYTYHPTYGTLLLTQQSHEGVASSVPYVGYIPDSAVDGEDRFTNALRLKQTLYPNNRTIYHNYGSSDSIADRLSRVDKLQEDSMGTPVDLTAYSYSGVGRLATADYVPIEVKLDLYQGATNGTYAGFDRFGRVKEHLWDDYDTGSPPNIAQVKYGYNEVGSRTWREDVMAAANSENHDEFYTHDGLHRLKTFDRGDLTGSPYSGINGTPSREEDYVLQQLGNWQSYTIKENGSTLLSQARSHNTANEIHSILTTSWTDPEHDAAGNMTRMPQPKNPAMAGGYTAVYDAWNRLISLSDSNGTVQVNEYDGLHRRIIRDETGGAGVLTHFYYNENWQCLEERTGSSGNANRQYVWHPYYIDALAVSYDLAGSKTFYTHDANFNVTAAINASGTVVERYQYTPYGEVTILEADFSPDGDNVSDIGNEFLYTGRRLDPETGLYQYRFRYYHAQLGRFVTRDPIEYVGGMNLYGYVGGMPNDFLDPYGLHPPFEYFADGEGGGSYAIGLGHKDLPEVPRRDSTGRIHDPIPDEVPDWGIEDVEDALGEVTGSLEERSRQGVENEGMDESHGRRYKKEKEWKDKLEKRRDQLLRQQQSNEVEPCPETTPDPHTPPIIIVPVSPGGNVPKPAPRGWGPFLHPSQIWQRIQAVPGLFFAPLPLIDPNNNLQWHDGPVGVPTA